MANELFYQQDSALALGVHPRLVRTRFGLHIVRVMGRRPGKRIPFEEARPRIERDLLLRARAVALRHYLHRLAAEARVCGVDLGAGDGPLVQ
ncbi:MAG: peptidylprolyl isomerase [Hydrogenophaga sp.]